jgi:hypothetical protein
MQKHENEKDEKHARKRRHIELAAKDLFVARKSHFEMSNEESRRANNDGESFVRRARPSSVTGNSLFVIVSP